MDKIICPNKECGGAVLVGDQFCGTCGWPVAEQPGPEETAFFSHEPARASGPLSSVTRSLCAAAYLNYGFASKVILNLLVTRRAVAPSVNFDVGPVLRHCLRARRQILIRDAVLVLILLTGLVIRTLPTLDILLYTIALGGVLPGGNRRGGFGTQLVLLLVTVVAGGLAVVLTVILVLGRVVSSVFVGGMAVASTMTGLTSLVGTFAILVGALAATEFVYLRVTAQALAAGSGPGVQVHRSLSRTAEQRMAVVEGAQWGNITLHSGWFPFIGAGAQTQAHWSIATPMRSRAGDDQGWGGTYVRIDPVEMHRFIGDRLRALNDPALPDNERISTLIVSDRLVGSGGLYVGNPLLDGELRTPYSHASRDAVEALIRHPQARLRYYQQVSVNDQSPVVMSHGREVIGDVDQEVVVSAFVYAAVEGRMLYLQFVLTALPPIDDRYRVRRLRYMSSVSSTLIYTFKRLFFSIMSAAPGIYSAFRLWRKERQVEKLYLTVSASDYGAEISVRELGTAAKFRRYMQVLDVEKYNMIFSQALLNAVTEYLGHLGIDTSAFTGIAQNIINNINTGNVYGDLNQQAGNKNSVNKPPNPS